MRRTPGHGAPHRRGPPRAGARHAPHAVPPTRRVSPEYGPEAPPPRGDRRRGRRSHLCGPAAPPAPGHPSRPQTERPARRTGAVAVAPKPSHRCARGRGPGPVLRPPRLNFLSSPNADTTRATNRGRTGRRWPDSVEVTIATGGGEAMPRARRGCHPWRASADPTASSTWSPDSHAKAYAARGER